MKLKFKKCPLEDICDYHLLNCEKKENGVSYFEKCTTYKEIEVKIIDRYRRCKHNEHSKVNSSSTHKR